jgi:DNA-binding transcriptional LysR family regulator
MLNLTHMHYFQTAARLKSLAQAAEKEKVTASAISQAIMQLEKHFGVSLLKHKKNRFELTESGQILLLRSHDLFAVTSGIEEAVANRGVPSGPVHFATQQSLALALLPQFLQQLQKSNPEIKPQINLMITSRVKKALQTRDVEFGLSVDNVGFDSFKHLPILNGNFLVISPKGARPNPQQDGFLLTESTKEVLRFKRGYEHKFGALPEVNMVVQSWGLIAKFVECGLGLGLVPDYMIRLGQNERVDVLDLGLPPIPYQVNAFYNDRLSTLSSGSQLFLGELQKFLSGI